MMRSITMCTLWMLACNPFGPEPDAGSCCGQCGFDHRVCMHCPGHFELCKRPPRSCSDLEGAELCACLDGDLWRGLGTCEVVDGNPRFTLNPAFCEYAADYDATGRLNACTYDPFVLP